MYSGSDSPSHVDIGDVHRVHHRSRCFGLWFSVSRHRLLRDSTRQRLKHENACTQWKLYEPLGKNVAWGYAEPGWRDSS